MAEPGQASSEDARKNPTISATQEQALLKSKVLTFLKSKDDTSRFTGLAILKAFLDNWPELREDEETITQLWSSISPKFLDRLIRTGSKSSAAGKDTREMLDLSVSIIHTFTTILPDRARQDASLVQRIPSLMTAILHRSVPDQSNPRHANPKLTPTSSKEITHLALQAMATITSYPAGAKEFMALDDISPLVEAAPAHPEALQTLSFAWLNTLSAPTRQNLVIDKIDKSILQLVSSFKGTDAVTLLEFLGSYLHYADPDVSISICLPQISSQAHTAKQTIPSWPQWLGPVVAFIKRLVLSRPTPEARSAYINAAAALLQAYPREAASALFSSDPTEEKPLPYLLTSLVLIDIRSSCPTLLEKINSPGYDQTSRRLASGYDIVSSFVGYLIRSLEDEDSVLVMDPNLLLKLRNSITETMAVTIEYLRDRWDASIAGAMGLHPDARSGAATTGTGSHLTLAWDSAKDNADNDPMILAAVRALAIWIREDDSSSLRKEASGLLDMLLDLYKSSLPTKYDFRSAVLVALEGILAVKKGKEAFFAHDGWAILAKDLLDIFQRTSKEINEPDASRGVEIVRILLPLAEEEETGTREAWMDTITSVAAWDAPDAEQPSLVQECQVSVLQLCAILLVRASPGMRKRYVHSMSAVSGIASQLRLYIGNDPALQGQVEDVLATLRSLR
ncbi:hypothetical protein jhhlp_002066 [Lomentospora prolificans]|uniref:DUF1941 family protein n=1 Tax=Lomentospora prolificans TaxID=41688 RepID=A0A2N3NCZ4_9PEZI|nr:hypothetical protein jhhlp_002066 [Lomentospora prolificans]